MFENYFKNLASLEENEEIELVVRHHWISFMGAFLKIIIPPIALLVLIYKVGLVKSLSWFDNVIFSWVFFIIFLIWATFTFYSWFIWYFDVAILTNKRVIVIEQKALFNKIVSAAGLEKIQDTTIQISGLVPTLFGYGSVIIQTAGEAANLVIRDIPEPGKVQQKILHLKHTENTDEPSTESPKS